MPTIYRNHKILDSFEGYIDQSAIDFARRVIDNLYIQPEISLFCAGKTELIWFRFDFDDINWLTACFYPEEGCTLHYFYQQGFPLPKGGVKNYYVKTDAQFIKLFLDISRK